MIRVDIIRNVADFVNGRQFLFFALVSKDWRDAWGQRPKLTSYVTADSSEGQLLYSFECGLPRDQVAVCTAIARIGQLELLKCAREKGCPWDRRTCGGAAKGGHLETLIWLRENGCLWDQWVCTLASLGGHLKVLIWAREKGCPWDEKTSQAAVSIDWKLIDNFHLNFTNR